jgi:tRNA-dihydrouridine synthase
MLSATALRHENVQTSPFTRKRTQEGRVVYQLRLTGEEQLGPCLEKLRAVEPFAIDLNLGCPAPEIRKMGGGAALFASKDRLRRVLADLRDHWDGILTVKCRLGAESDGWEAAFVERLRLFDELDIDAVTVHPRFTGQKLKRSAQWHLFGWIAGETDIPLIANGDIVSPDEVDHRADELRGVAGLMIGRMAAVKPWVFREFGGEAVDVDYLDVWERLYQYTLEDFVPEKAIGRIKEFTTYYARNFFFGHQLFKQVQGAANLEVLHQRAIEFLTALPKTTRSPSVNGL